MIGRVLTRPLLALALLLLAVLARGALPRAASAGDRERGPAPVPADNASHVSDAAPELLSDWAAAEDALEKGRPAGAAEAFQRIIERRFEDPARGVLVPHVSAVDGTSLYEGAWRVAEHRLIGGTAALRQAYAALYGRAAQALLDSARTRLDEGQLADAVRRYRTLPAGREAALLLADLCRERGEDDLALGWLERLEALEELSAEPPEELGAWRARRIALEARVRAVSPAQVPAVVAALAAVAGTPGAARAERVPFALQRPPPTQTRWGTTGGAPHRTARCAALGTALTPKALVPLAPAEERAFEHTPGERPEPSPWLPPRAILGPDALFVCDGATLQAFAPESLRLLDRVGLGLPDGAEGRAQSEDDAREGLPLAEGHALSADRRSDGTTRLFVAAVRRVFSGELPDRRPDGSLIAFLWDGRTLMRRWVAGGLAGRTALEPDLALFGAPCLYRGLVWMAGVRPTPATPDRVEAWLVGLDPETGQARRQVHLGTGSPVRSKRVDEAVPSAPAAAHGRLIVPTALGFVAAVDAEDGRVEWVYRYDRAVERGRTRRLGSDEEEARRRETSFANEPPLIAFDLAVVAPTDSELLYGLALRPFGPERALVLWEPRHRRLDMPRIALEQLVGATGGTGGVPPTIVAVGQGDPESDLPGQLVVGLSARTGRPLWGATADTGRRAVPLGRALVTAGEVFVCTRHGLRVIDLADRSREILLRAAGADAVPAGLGDEVTEAAWAGNLIPVPGVGLVAVGLDHVALWAR